MMYYIWSYEHDRWWKPGGCGYTNKLIEAGRFHEETARIKQLEANYPTSVVNEVIISEELVKRIQENQI